MKYKYTILLGITFGIIMTILWNVVFMNIIGPAGFGVSIGLGVAFACCGCLFGYSIDKKNKDKED